MAFLILGWVGSAKGLVSYVNYLLWKGCGCLNKFHVKQNAVLRVKSSASVEWEKQCGYMWMSVYFKICTYLHIKLICACFFMYLYMMTFCPLTTRCPVCVGPVDKPDVLQLRRVTILSDHLFPTLSHSRLAVLITACFSCFLTSGSP